jgi:hypothetical protein
MDARGAFFGLPPAGPVLRSAPEAAIGFLEAQGLALILALQAQRRALALERTPHAHRMSCSNIATPI